MLKSGVICISKAMTTMQATQKRMNLSRTAFQTSNPKVSGTITMHVRFHPANGTMVDSWLVHNRNRST